MSVVSEVDGRAVASQGSFGLVAAGYRIEAPPHDAEWGERFFHVTDPDGHELSFAWPLKRG